jgi:hypothetical protein
MQAGTLRSHFPFRDYAVCYLSGELSGQQGLDGVPGGLGLAILPGDVQSLIAEERRHSRDPATLRKVLDGLTGR